MNEGGYERIFMICITNIIMMTVMWSDFSPPQHDRHVDDLHHHAP
jgi:hypothetical protein